MALGRGSAWEGVVRVASIEFKRDESPLDSPLVKLNSFFSVKIVPFDRGDNSSKLLGNMSLSVPRTGFQSVICRAGRASSAG